MKLGIALHPNRGIDALMEEARVADQQGFDSIWLSDHLMNTAGQDSPMMPFENFTLMTALGAVTSRTRLAWAMLNSGFRPPALLAKMFTTLDQVSHGRVICTLGAGWFKPEYEAYGLPLIDDHDARIEYEREVVMLFKQLWEHPAPERTTFEGKHVRVVDLPFSPAPYQQPHPPIWIGGDSEATQSLVKELADGWVMARSGNRETLTRIRSRNDWPQRELTLVSSRRIFVALTREEALNEARAEFAAAPPAASGVPVSFDDFLSREVVGTPDECVARLSEMESWGVNYLRLTFNSEDAQERVAELLLPRLAEWESAPALST